VIDGVAVLDKPPGLTSHDVVARVRRELGVRKVGHAGTLDPNATGVLVLGFGRGTRLLGFLTASEKTYEATIRLGASTVTDDADGAIIEQTPSEFVEAISDSAIEAAIANLTGSIDQVPSAVSAVKSGGVRAHARVRAGEEVQLAPRRVEVFEFTLERVSRTEHLDIDVRVRCSAGTYIRALARDLGKALKVGGHVQRLRRVASGTFDEPIPLDEFLVDPRFITLADAVRTVMPVIAVDDAIAHAVRHGRLLPWPDDVARGTIGIVDEAGTLLAIGEPRNDEMRYAAVFVGAGEP
jgi:tRNA pseudouridine55 synthase